ncbi:Staphylococcal AgrD [Syntrophomonas zehnderi OL-4]|uniref:Staphylococcal AgrD n=1 Tax=Syntrophomonas zehnderi OL-4 TaxID=690567 RepID=A0A0E4C9R9_9FIRM|nr:cyclic lactone autoinducer peptide [Syntrophomonas zehnderi]CFY10906.1 Staphylococcal AgrD [Syntrophomonas zehnderi OL-4]
MLKNIFNNSKRFILVNLALMLTFIAHSGVSSISIWTVYEPNIPECLQRQDD